MEPLFGLDPLLWNIFVTFLVFVYIMSIIKIMDVLVTKGFPQDVSRKIIHIAAGSWIIFWPLYYGGHWSYVLNIAVAVLWTILFLVKGLTATPDDPAVKTMTRTGDPKELLKGPLFFTLVMEFVGIFFFMDIRGIVTMAALGWGDGLAPLFGKRFGTIKYSILNNEKSLQGSLAMLVFSYLASLMFSLIILPSAINITFIINLLIIALVATIIEAISPKDIDNILIPLVILPATMILFII